MENWIHALLNCLFVGVPEEIVWCLLSLVFLKRFDLLDKYRWKESIKYLAIPIIPTAVSINVFRYILVTPKIVIFLGSGAIFYSLLVYIVKKTSITEQEVSYLKILIYAFLASLIIGISESVYLPIGLYVSKLTLSEVVNSQTLNILFSIPSRVFQIMLIWILIRKNSSYSKDYFLENVFKDKFLAVITVLFMGLILFVVYFIIFIFGDLNIIEQYSLPLQVLITILIVTIPTCLVFLYTIPINHLINHIKKMQISHQNMLDDDIN